MRRGFTIALLLVEALFFNVVIPAHTRGMIELPGSRSGSPCCENKPNHSKQTPADNNRTSHCAVCAFAARMSLPPAVEFAPVPTGLAEILEIVAPEKIFSRKLPPTYLGRAPPAFA